MKRYAQIFQGKVHWLADEDFSLEDIYKRKYNPNIKFVEVPDGTTVQEGFLYDGKDFTPPVISDPNANRYTNLTFSGVCTAPTAAAGTNTDQIATTAFVTTAIANKTSVATAAKLGKSGDANAPMVFNWSGQDGQPSWLWGGNDGTNMYVYNPANFSVAAAGTAYNIPTSAGHGNIWIS